MRIRSFSHKGLALLFMRGDGRRLPSYAVEKLRKMPGFLQAMKDAEELRTLPVWRPHRLSGDRRDVWALVVTRNWRLTFRIDTVERELFDIDFEDYH
jgi:proteic killer suppression protein